MKKDAFYFPHFCNARHDRKLKRVQKELGIEGYGIYFMLLEILREQTDLRYPISEIDLLADEFGTSEQKIRTVICNYDLFQVDQNENFFSFKMLIYLQPYFEKSDRARVAANKRWNNANAYANALQMECGSNASKVKESKLKKSKVKEIDYDTLSNEILNSEVWIQNIAMHHKLDINFVNEKLDFFLEEVKLKDDWHKGIKEVKAHFINWLKIQKEKNSAKKENENETNRFTGTVNAINALLRK